MANKYTKNINKNVFLLSSVTGELALLPVVQQSFEGDPTRALNCWQKKPWPVPCPVDHGTLLIY